MRKLNSLEVLKSYIDYLCLNLMIMIALFGPDSLYLSYRIEQCYGEQLGSATLLHHLHSEIQNTGQVTYEYCLILLFSIVTLDLMMDIVSSVPFILSLTTTFPPTNGLACYNCITRNRSY